MIPAIDGVGSPRHDRAMSGRRVVVVAFDGVQMLDVVGPVEVFSVANRLGAEPGYSVHVVAEEGGSVTTSSGLVLGVSAIDNVRGEVDTLVVAGGLGVRTARQDAHLGRAVVRLASRSRRVVGVCTGALLLAEVGLLDVKRAVTHWASCDHLAERYPDVTVEPDPIYVRDGNVWTSAGVTAGMDLALALVADDHGAGMAREVARWLVLYLHRPGGQSQYSAHLAAQAAEREPFRALVVWIAEHPRHDLSVANLARRVGMSERHFTRAFKAETGLTPADHVLRVRIELARRLLETTDQSVSAVARRSGFHNPETMHRAFRRRLGTTPMTYRQANACPGAA
jgi:transcriptional regulator GlxA family with amidase domain